VTTEVITDTGAVPQAVADEKASGKLLVEAVAVEVTLGVVEVALGAVERLARVVAGLNARVPVGVLDAETTIVDVRFTVSVTVARLVDVAAVGSMLEDRRVAEAETLASASARYERTEERMVLE